MLNARSFAQDSFLYVMLYYTRGLGTERSTAETFLFQALLCDCPAAG